MTPETNTKERLLPMREVTYMTGHSRNSIYRDMAAGAFPRPVKLGRTSVWPETEVQQWIEDRKAERKLG